MISHPNFTLSHLFSIAFSEKMGGACEMPCKRGYTYEYIIIYKLSLLPSIWDLYHVYYCYMFIVQIYPVYSWIPLHLYIDLVSALKSRTTT